jgi:hypothetical protein
MTRYFLRIGITVLIVAGGWVVRDRIVPGMLFYQHVVASAAFIVFIQIVWQIFEWLHRWLDRWMPFARNLYGRIMVQLGLGVLVLLGIRVVMLVPLQRWLPVMRDEVVVTMMMIANVGMALAINLLFISGHFIRQWKEGVARAAGVEVEKERAVTDQQRNLKPVPEDSRSTFKEHFLVQQGTVSTLVDDKDIAGFIKQDLIFLVQADRRKLITSYRSLDEVEALVDPARYYRVNRQQLIHRRVISGYRVGQQGKVILTTTVDMGDVMVSKEKAAAFKKWFDAHNVPRHERKLQ